MQHRSPFALALWGSLLALLVGLNIYQYCVRLFRENVSVHAEASGFVRERFEWLSKRVAANTLRLEETSSKLLDRLAELSEQKVVDQFHEIFYERMTANWGVHRWLGIPTGQNPNDVWIIQEIISELKPDFIVETGTAKGGSAALWALVLDQVNPAGRVITIDITDNAHEARKLPLVREKVEFLIGSSTSPRIVATVTAQVAGHKVLVILDSDHHKEHVLDELEAYSSLVPLGSYLIVQDTNINGHPVREDFGPGPMEAVEEFLSTDDRFEPDRSRERLLFTMHPKGYLKRVNRGRIGTAGHP